MFSTRSLVSTALFALVASTPVSPLQFSVEQDRSPWTNSYSTAMYAGCDGLESTSFKSGYKPTLVRIEGGTNACVYRFAPGWPWKDTGSVGKTLQSGGSFREGFGSEVDTLEQIGELHAHEKDVSGRDWVVMKAQPGKWLSETQEYIGIHSALDNAKSDCRLFFQSVYRAVYLDAKRYISEFGCIHHGNAEMGEANVLIEFTGNQVGAHLIDWANTDCSPGNKPNAITCARELCADYASSASPVDDCGGAFSLQQAHHYCLGLNV